MVRGVSNIEEALQKEFPSWFKNHVSWLENASEDLKSLADGPDKRVIVHSSCNVKGAQFCTVTLEKNLRTQNYEVMNKASVASEQDTEHYGVLQESSRAEVCA
jgi:NAD(P)H-dependent FMN reductase